MVTLLFLTNEWQEETIFNPEFEVQPAKWGRHIGWRDTGLSNPFILSSHSYFSTFLALEEELVL